MSRLAEAFARGRKTLVAYLCVGDPDEASSVDIALACVEAGADVLELGCPFSDPTADGPAIERASQRALAKGGGLDATIRAARAIRERCATPIVLFGYYNPIFVRGEEKVVEMAAAAGIDAFLVVDLPLEAATNLRTLAAKRGISVIPLVAPTSTEAHVAAIADLATRLPVPFVYYVSTTGVTGGAGETSALTAAGASAAKVREATKCPTVVGFGIDSGARARAAAQGGADGIVVGSAIVRRIEDGDDTTRIASVRALVTELAAAIAF